MPNVSHALPAVRVLGLRSPLMRGEGTYRLSHSATIFISKNSEHPSWSPAMRLLGIAWQSKWLFFFFLHKTAIPLGSHWPSLPERCSLEIRLPWVVSPNAEKPEIMSISLNKRTESLKLTSEMSNNSPETDVLMPNTYSHDNLYSF